jgi:hypothetical protein
MVAEESSKILLEELCDVHSDACTHAVIGLHSALWLCWCIIRFTVSSFYVPARNRR